jgi:hypothetical protein
MVKIAHQIREQLEYYRKNSGNLATVKVEDAALLDIKKSTRNLISLNDNHTAENEQEVTISHTNFLRRNIEDW